MFDWVFDVPLWIAGPVLVTLLGGFSLVGLLTVRKRILPRLRITPADSHFVGPMVHSVMVFYALVLALIAVNVFETYADASRIVSTEATALAMLYRDVSSYAEPERSQLQLALRDYVDQVIHEAWPQQRAGRIPTGGVLKMDIVQERLSRFEPRSESQRILHAEAWSAYNRVVEARRARVDEVRTGLPGVMWLVVILGAAISLISSFFFHVEDVRLHAVLVMLLATFIASVIFVMLAMDHPFRGDLGISSESYELIYNQLMRR